MSSVDYVDPENWLVRDDSRSRPADLFHVHTTTWACKPGDSVGGFEFSMNADPKFEQPVEKDPTGVTRDRFKPYLTSAFEPVCNVWTPRYRQMNMAGFFSVPASDATEEGIAVYAEAILTVIACRCEGSVSKLFGLPGAGTTLLPREPFAGHLARHFADQGIH